MVVAYGLGNMQGSRSTGVWRFGNGFIGSVYLIVYFVSGSAFCNTGKFMIPAKVTEVKRKATGE